MSIAGTSKQVTSNSTRSRKTVRFAGSDDNDSNNSCHVDGTVVSIDDIDQKTGDQLYWTEAQLLQFQRQAKQVARKYRQNIPYVAAVKRILQSHRSVSSDNAADSNVNTAAADAAADVVQVLWNRLRAAWNLILSPCSNSIVSAPFAPFWNCKIR
jgi:hypothetical protein